MSTDSKPLRDDPSKKWGFADVFLTQFQSSKIDLEKRLNAAKESASEGPGTGTGTKETLDDLTIDFIRISKSLRDAIGLVPKTDQGSCEAQLKIIENSLEDLRKSSVPKSKFAFKRKPKAEGTSTTSSNTSTSATAITNSATPSSVSQDASDASVSTPTTNLTLSSHSQEYLTLHSITGLPNASNSSATQLRSDLFLADLDNCVVNLLSPPIEMVLDISAVQIRNLNNCIVLLPKINGSVMLHVMKHCVIILGCHQFRIHSSQNVDVYLDIRPNPIIEHSTGIRFAPYPSFLDGSISPPNSDESVSRSNLSVQDFSHIRPTPSPNWSLLSKDDVENARLTRVKELVSASEKDHQQDVSEVLGGILPSQT